MKLIAGSILTGLSLLSLVFGHLSVGKWEDYRVELDTPVEVLVILFMAVGIGLIIWGLWPTRDKHSRR